MPYFSLQKSELNCFNESNLEKAKNVKILFFKFFDLFFCTEQRSFLRSLVEQNLMEGNDAPNVFLKKVSLSSTLFMCGVIVV